MKKNMPAITVSIYASLVALGGIIGYLKAGSLPSLIAGLSFSIMLAYTAYGMFKSCAMSKNIATVLTAFLGLFFTYRFILSNAFMPAGLMIILSLLTFIILISTFCSCKKSCQ